MRTLLRLQACVLAGILALAGCDRVRDQAPAPVAVPSELICLLDSATGRVELPVLGVPYTIRFQPGSHGQIVADSGRPGGFIYQAGVGFAGQDIVPFALSRQGVAAAEQGRVLVRLHPNACLPRAVADTITMKTPEPVLIAVLSNDTLCPNTQLVGVTPLSQGQGIWHVEGDKLKYERPNGLPRQSRDSARYRIRGPHGFLQEAEVKVAIRLPVPPMQRSCADIFQPHDDTIVLRRIPQGAYVGDTTLESILANDSACVEERPQIRGSFQYFNTVRGLQVLLTRGSLRCTLSTVADSTRPVRIEYIVKRGGGRPDQPPQTKHAFIYFIRR